MRQKKQKKEFNDLLIPIIIILAVLPFVTRLIIYQSGLSQYTWFSDNDAITDFFSYYKSYVFILISILCTIVSAIYILLHKKDGKEYKPFVLIGIYILLAILSTIFSVDRKLSILGGISHFENVFVIIGYAAMLFYTYCINKSEQDYRIILKAIITSSVLLCIIGFMQMFGKDPVSFPIIQKLIIPRQYWGKLGEISFNLTSNAVSLTLFNSNYASVYLAMLIPFLLSIVMPINNDSKNTIKNNPLHRKQYILLLIAMSLMILLFKTYSRAGLVAMLTSVSVLLIFYHRQWKSYWKSICIVSASVAILFVGIDAIYEFRYIHKITGTFRSFTNTQNQNSLEEIITEKDQILIRYQGEEIIVSYENEDDSEAPFLTFWDKEGKNISEHYDSANRTIQYTPFEKLQFYIEKEETLHSNILYCVIDGITWRFMYSDLDGYVYLNDFGKADKLTKVNRIGFRNTEHIGSGRGYIWSRSIPLLKETILLGKGPDTYPIVFPQSDYVGKANNCKTPYTLIEKPHNMYLMTGIHTGILSLIAVITFYMLYLVQSIRIYRKCERNTLTERIGIGCLMSTLSFMISGIFNDSSIQTTPLFIVMLGLGMDINHELRVNK